MKRKQWTVRQKQYLIAKQQGYCFYCGQAFGELSWYKRPVVLCPEVEHLVPFGLAGNDESDNIVMACQVCNMIKKGRLFDTFYQLVELIQSKWLQHGEMTLNRKVIPDAVKRIKSMYIRYGETVGDWPRLTDSQIKWIKKMIKEHRRK